jgi:hypothetical protein
MGYFDALTSSSFKTTRDGRRLFFPWGVCGRGYVIGSELDYERLRGQIKIFFIVVMALMLGAVALQRYLAALLVLAALYLFYLAWTRYLLQGLQPSDERLSLRESMTSQAREQSPILLWVAEIGSIVLVAASILIFAFDPGNWLVATAGLVFFGLCAASITFMLVLRWRT